MARTQKQRMLAQELYIAADPTLKKEAKQAKVLLHRFNQLAPEHFSKQQELLKQLLGKVGQNYYIEPPFYCDYGQNTYIGENFYANTNAIFLDVAKITIGDNVMFGPRVSLYTAGHPLDPDVRNIGLEFGKEIKIGDNVWLGGNVVVCPGVTIGANSVIGAGSVVTKDIAKNSIAVGNPCKVLRKLNQKDREYWQSQRQDYIAEMGAFISD